MLFPIGVHVNDEILGTVILKPYELLAEWPWLAPTLLTYTGHVIAGLVKFRKVPSYHTYMAKASWLLIAIGAITFLLGYSPWPLRTALAAITITNLEAIAIVCPSHLNPDFFFNFLTYPNEIVIVPAPEVAGEFCEKGFITDRIRGIDGYTSPP